MSIWEFCNKGYRRDFKFEISQIAKDNKQAEEILTKWIENPNNNTIISYYITLIREMQLDGDTIVLINRACFSNMDIIWRVINEIYLNEISPKDITYKLVNELVRKVW